MKIILLAFALGPLLVRGQQSFLRLWRDEGCSADAAEDAYFDLLLPNDNNGCQGGTTIRPWPTDANGEYIVWVTGEGIGDDCQSSLLRQNAAEPDACGEAYVTINGGTAGPCRQTVLPRNFGVNRCCGQEGCTPVGTRFGDSANTTTTAKDVTLAKRTLPFASKRQAECTFAGGAPYDSRGPQEIVSNDITCSSGDGSACMYMNSTSVTTSSSNTFGASVEAGGSLFEIIQVSTTFSYEYTFEMSKSNEESYTISVPPGQNGAITYTAAVQCVDGQFSGDNCGGWTVKEDGTACIPLLRQGAPYGTFAFVREF